MLNISQAASYEIILVYLSVHLSILLSLNFLKIGSLVFSDIVLIFYNESLQQCLTSIKGKTLKIKKIKKFGPQIFVSNGPKSGPKLVFLQFSQV